MVIEYTSLSWLWNLIISPCVEESPQRRHRDPRGEGVGRGKRGWRRWDLDSVKIWIKIKGGKRKKDGISSPVEIQIGDKWKETSPLWATRTDSVLLGIDPSCPLAPLEVLMMGENAGYLPEMSNLVTVKAVAFHFNPRQAIQWPLYGSICIYYVFFYLGYSFDLSSVSRKKISCKNRGSKRRQRAANKETESCAGWW